jgi:hypothetical protein
MGSDSKPTVEQYDNEIVGELLTKEYEGVIVIEGEILIYHDDGAGWVSFETTLGDNEPLSIEDIHIHDLQEHKEAEIRINSVRFESDT